MNDLVTLYLCLGVAAVLSAIVRVVYLCKIKSPKGEEFKAAFWGMLENTGVPDWAASLALAVTVLGYLAVCLIAWPYVLYGIIKRKKA